MNLTHESLVIEAPGSRADSLGPAQIQRALHHALQLTSEEIGIISPLRRGSAEVEIALGRALAIPTPVLLPFSDASGPSLALLKRKSDPAEHSRRYIRVSWEGPRRPGPSTLVQALIEASEGCFNAEDLSVTFECHDFILTELSEGLSQRLSFPCSCTCDDIKLSLEALSGSGL